MFRTGRICTVKVYGYNSLDIDFNCLERKHYWIVKKFELDITFSAAAGSLTCDFNTKLRMRRWRSEPSCGGAWLNYLIRLPGADLPLDISLGIYQNISRIDIHSTDSDQRALNSFHAGFLIVRLHDSSQHPSKSPSKLFVFIIELSGDVRIGGKMRSI